MYTANTMASAAEVLGMTLPGSSSFPAESEEKLQECRSVGPAILNLLQKNILPRDIMTRTAFENALVTISPTNSGITLTRTIAFVGSYHGPRWIYKCCFTPHRYGSFSWHPAHPRRNPSCVRSNPIPRGSEAQRKICDGGRAHSGWHSQ
jgi:Dehydratase family